MSPTVDYRPLKSSDVDEEDQPISENKEALSQKERVHNFCALCLPSAIIDVMETCKICIPWRGLFEACLLIVAICSLFLLYSRETELGPGETTFVQIQSHPVRFQATDHWLEPIMFHNVTVLEEKMKRFNELSGDDRGVVMIDDWERYSLPRPQLLDVSKLKGEPTPPKPSYTIAYYHHIHCVATIAKLFSNARMGLGEVEHDDEHMVHCLEVLRMAVMCLADTTPEDGENHWQNTHQCRDHSQLQAWASERAVWNFTEMIGERVDFL